MALVAKLEDVKQQLLQATEVVQLHVRLTKDLATLAGPDAEEHDILELITSVEQAQSSLQLTTTQLLHIILEKCCSSARSTDKRVRSIIGHDIKQLI